METIEDRLQRWFRAPWLIYHKPFEIVDKVYFVGNKWVSAFLLDTDEGLVLIDCAIQETFYQMVDNISFRENLPVSNDGRKSATLCSSSALIRSGNSMAMNRRMVKYLRQDSTALFLSAQALLYCWQSAKITRQGIVQSAEFACRPKVRLTS